jgi:GNAT superfamily N-acetyltransferase
MFQIRLAISSDVDAIHNLIYELAVFEKAPEQLLNPPERLLRDGFGPNPKFVCFVAEQNKTIVGMSFCYVRYSTWKGPVLYLEDLIVTESFRRIGIGKALFQYTCNYALENNYTRLQWQVLDWNQSAIDFYKRFDASFDPEWLNAWVELKSN